MNAYHVHKGEKELKGSHVRFNDNQCLGKEFVDWDEIPLVRSWLNGNHRLAIGTRAQQESTKAL